MILAVPQLCQLPKFFPGSIYDIAELDAVAEYERSISISGSGSSTTGFGSSSGGSSDAENESDKKQVGVHGESKADREAEVIECVEEEEE